MQILAIHDRFHGLDIKYKVEVPFASVHAPIHLDENTYDIRLSRRDPPGPILHEFMAHHKRVRLEDIYGGPVHKHEYHSKDKGDYEKDDSSESGKHKNYDEKHHNHGDHDDHYGKPRDYEKGYDGSKEDGHDYERPNYHGNHHEDNYEKRISADIPDGAFENIEKVDEKDSTHQESANRNAGVVEKQVADDQHKYENSDEEVDQIQGQKDDDIKTTTPIHEDLEESHATTTSSDSHEYEDTAQKTSTTQEASEEQEPTTQGYTREENKADQDKKEGNGGLRQAAEAEKSESTTTTTTTVSTTATTESTTMTTEENYAESSTTETEEYEEDSREHNKRNFREDTTSEPSTKTTPDYLIEEAETTANPTESTTITTPDPYENHYEIDLKSASLEEEEKGWSPHDRRKRQAPNSKKRKCKSKSPVVLDPRCIYDETTPVALGFCRVDFLLCMPKGDGYRAFCLQNQLFDQTSGKCVPAGQCGEHANSARPTQNISSLAQNPPKTTPDLTSEEGFCVGKKNGLYKHPRNCSQIWKCTNGTVSEHPGCAPDLAFNEKRGLCDFRHTVPGCSLEEPTALGPIEGKALDPVLNRNFTIPSNTRSCGTLNHGDHIAHESDCTLYHQCVWGSLELMRCPAGTFFNPEMNVCDYSHAVPGCNASSVNNGTNSSTDSS
uniref:Chitin-binding type-2 domain-containing protein n=1 Tax=Acrobeloides nanus TaxID=290746 RepID=A0A914ECP3_9BILA